MPPHREQARPAICIMPPYREQAKLAICISPPHREQASPPSSPATRDHSPPEIVICLAPACNPRPRPTPLPTKPVALRSTKIISSETTSRSRTTSSETTTPGHAPPRPLLCLPIEPAIFAPWCACMAE